MLKLIAKLLKVLNSDTDPSQISLAVCFSMIVGLTPFFSLHNLMILLLALFIRVNLSSFLLGLALFSGVAYLLDPLFHRCPGPVSRLPLHPPGGKKAAAGVSF